MNSTTAPRPAQQGTPVRQLGSPVSGGLTGGQGGVFAAGEPQPVRVFIASILEPMIAVVALFAACLITGEEIDRPEQVLAILLLLLCFPGTNRFGDKPGSALLDVCSAWISVLCILALCGYATRSLHLFDRLSLYIWAAMTPALQFLAVQAGRKILRLRATESSLRRPALIVGANGLGARVSQVLRKREIDGYDFIGFVEDRTSDRCDPGTLPHIRGRFDDLPELIQRHRIRDVFVALPLSMQPRIVRMLGSLQDSAVSIHYVPDVFGVSVIQGRMSSLDGVPVVSLLESPFEGVNGLIKRLSDIVLASIILLLISPLLLVIALAIKLTSPGPAIFKQRRHGLDGEEIVVYKFRSMTTTDNGPVVQQAQRNDPRITKLGGFLRRTSLDELPQFINVLQGRMSIVGPRPHAVAHNEHYRQLIRAYMVRHKVRPGITGWAQVNGLRGETDTLDKMAARVDYDLEYLRSWSLALDLRIIARTAGLTLLDRNAY
jgi:putative colanic acid biosynthesis UDP-glucose lipid carrier transferase